MKRHFQCAADPTMIREWSDHDPTMKPSVRNPPRNRGSFSRPPRAFCIEKYNISRSGYHSKFYRILLLPRKVTLQLHQILRLPRKVTLELHQILPLPRKVTLQLHQILRLPRKVTLELQQIELLLDWAMTWLSYYLTELWLDWAITWLSYYLTELLLDWAIQGELSLVHAGFVSLVHAGFVSLVHAGFVSLVHAGSQVVSSRDHVVQKGEATISTNVKNNLVWFCFM